jgi:hypothetical protein
MKYLSVPHNTVMALWVWIMLCQWPNINKGKVLMMKRQEDSQSKGPGGRSKRPFGWERVVGKAPLTGTASSMHMHKEHTNKVEIWNDERGAIFHLGNCAVGEPRGDDELGTQSQKPSIPIICRLQLEGPRYRAGDLQRWCHKRLSIMLKYLLLWLKSVRRNFWA